MKGRLNLEVEYLRISRVSPVQPFLEKNFMYTICALDINIIMSCVCIYLAEAYILLFMQLMNTIILMKQSLLKWVMTPISMLPFFRIHTWAFLFIKYYSECKYQYINLGSSVNLSLYSNFFRTSHAHIMALSLTLKSNSQC